MRKKKRKRETKEDTLVRYILQCGQHGSPVRGLTNIYGRHTREHHRIPRNQKSAQADLQVSSAAGHANQVHFTSAACLLLHHCCPSKGSDRKCDSCVYYISLKYSGLYSCNTKVEKVSNDGKRVVIDECQSCSRQELMRPCLELAFNI